MRAVSYGTSLIDSHRKLIETKLTFELTHLSIVELKSTALNHSAKLADIRLICYYLNT